MTADPNQRLVAAFGNVLQRSRLEQKWTEEGLAAAAGLSGADLVAKMERGECEPSLTEFFRIADAIGDPPGVLFISLVAAWLADPVDDALFQSRRSDFVRLYRLGYSERTGDFREQHKVYSTVDEATAAVRRLNVERHKRSLKPLDTITIYIRMGFTSFASALTTVGPLDHRG